MNWPRIWSRRSTGCCGPRPRGEDEESAGDGDSHAAPGGVPGPRREPADPPRPRLPPLPESPARAAVPIPAEVARGRPRGLPHARGASRLVGDGPPDRTVPPLPSRRLRPGAAEEAVRDTVLEGPWRERLPGATDPLPGVRGDG